MSNKSSNHKISDINYYYRFEIYFSYDLKKAEKHAEKYCHYLEKYPFHRWNDEVLHIMVLLDLSRIDARKKDLSGMERYFQKIRQGHQALLLKYKQKLQNDPNLQYDAGELLESIYLVYSINYNELQQWKQAKQCLDEYLSHFSSEKEYAKSVFNNGKIFEEQASNCYRLGLMEDAEQYAIKSIEAAEKRKVVNLISYLILAECYYRKKNFSDALITAEKGMIIPEGWISSGDFSNVMEAQLYLLACECCIKLKKTQKAQKYLDTAEKISQHLKIIRRIKILKNEITAL